MSIFTSKVPALPKDYPPVRFQHYTRMDRLKVRFNVVLLLTIMIIAGTLIYKLRTVFNPFLGLVCVCVCVCVMKNKFNSHKS